MQACTARPGVDEQLVGARLTLTIRVTRKSKRGYQQKKQDLVYFIHFDGIE
jgi:hypothetical protein